MEKQRLLYQQSRLHNRGAAEMVLQMISACKGNLAPSLWLTLLACKDSVYPSCIYNFAFLSFFLFLLFLNVGETGPMVTTTLKLGISILNGGNSEVQRVCVLKKTKPSVIMT